MQAAHASILHTAHVCCTSNTAIFPSCLCNTVCLVSLCYAMATFMACLCKAMAESILWHPFSATSRMRVPCSTSLAQNASMLPCLGVKLNFMSGNSNTAPVGSVLEPARTKRFKGWGCSKLVAQNLLNYRKCSHLESTM